jgi:hypothetical protein
MPSTVTTVVSARIRPTDADRLREAARERDMSLSALLASLTAEGLARLKAA